MTYDIAIIGGGMVGGALAAALHDSPFRIALIDAAPKNTTMDHRLIALNHNSYCLLKNIGVWPALRAHAAAIHEVHVSHRYHFGSTRLTAAEVELPTLGYVLPACHIADALSQQVNLLSHITTYPETSVTDLTQTESDVVLTLSSGKPIRSHIVIAADGTYSTVRDLLHIQTETVDYQQRALVTITQLSRDHQHIAYERFHSSGAIAMLPLTGQRVATIWTDQSDTIAALMALPDAVFLKQLQAQFGYRLGRLQHIAQRYTYLLKQIKAKQQIDHRVMLIGNAAHTLHPIAAQGLNIAFHEIAVLVAALQNQSAQPLSLQNVHLSIPASKTSGMALSHSLTQLFSMDFFLIKIARQLGMVGLNLSHTLKKRFTRYAMNMTHSLPPLLSDKECYDRTTPPY